MFMPAAKGSARTPLGPITTIKNNNNKCMFKQSSWPVCGTVKAWEWMVVFQLAKLEFDNV
jgi:hypothetical protein